jgi:hypothetical protein
MGMTPRLFRRWLHQKPNAKPASVLARDGFDAYVRELRATLDEDPITDRKSAEATPAKRRHTGGIPALRLIVDNTIDID